MHMDLIWPFSSASFPCRSYHWFWWEAECYSQWKVSQYHMGEVWLHNAYSRGCCWVFWCMHYSHQGSGFGKVRISWEYRASECHIWNIYLCQICQANHIGDAALCGPETREGLPLSQLCCFSHSSRSSSPPLQLWKVEWRIILPWFSEWHHIVLQLLSRGNSEGPQEQE